MKRTITFLLLLSSLVFGQTFQNGTFEFWTGNNPDGWFLFDESGDVVFKRGENLGKTGDALIVEAVNNNSGLDGYIQAFITEISGNTDYNFSINLKSNDDQINARFYNCEWIDNNEEVISSFNISGYSQPTGNNWIELSTNNITSPSNAVKIKIDIKFYIQTDFIQNNSQILVDDLSNNNSPLPVELTTFSASVIDKNVKLNWETATEVNNYGFDIERKSEFGNWNKLAFVQGNGNSNSPKFYSFKDNSIKESGKYFYRLKQIDIDGKFDYSDEVEICFASPQKYELLQNYPNPFNPVTKITYSIPDNILFQNQKVTLKIYNVLGQLVKVLVDEIKQPGIYEIEFDGSKFISGVYFYKLETGDFTQMKKMILTK
ncbi:MAG: T9SS type A sorting domain-containing protein [Ignavibacteriae bacterium]|nr:T9SS type A sorting domain-containing protein [Ignavibacteriota bacterium]